MTAAAAGFAEPLGHHRRDFFDKDMLQLFDFERVSTGTVRAQLRTIFAKTGTRRPSQLVALILPYSRPSKHGSG
ncbi:MAG: hypothetical protein ACREDM_14715 [Methylocella sp.]